MMGKMERIQETSTGSTGKDCRIRMVIIIITRKKKMKMMMTDIHERRKIVEVQHSNTKKERKSQSFA